MQSFEATLSLMVLSSLAIAMAGAAVPDGGPDDSLLRLRLAQDAWRVLHLRGDFHDFHSGPNPALIQDMESITEKSGMCVFLMGSANYTSCRGGEKRETTASLSRAVVIDGRPRKVAFSLGK